MNKLPLRLIVFSTFLIILCGGVAHNEVRAKPMAPARKTRQISSTHKPRDFC